MTADLELLLIAQQSLRRHPSRLNANHLFEVERAIEEVQGGAWCSHTDTVMRFARAYVLEVIA